MKRNQNFEIKLRIQKSPNLYFFSHFLNALPYRLNLCSVYHDAPCRSGAAGCSPLPELWFSLSTGRFRFSGELWTEASGLAPPTACSHWAVMAAWLSRSAACGICSLRRPLCGGALRWSSSALQEKLRSVQDLPHVSALEMLYRVLVQGYFSSLHTLQVRQNRALG